jgi:hypothetical protein
VSLPVDVQIVNVNFYAVLLVMQNRQDSTIQQVKGWADIRTLLLQLSQKL